jgi:hypothetical protein
MDFFWRMKEEQMKTKSAWPIALVIIILFLSGCAPPPQGIHTSCLRNVNSGNYDVRVDQFSSGETPAIVVTGCSGQTITVRVYNVFSGQVINEVTGHITQDKAQWWPLTDLPNGSYQVGLLIGGNTVSAANFNVRR